MNFIEKAASAVARFVPDRSPDPLMDADDCVRRPLSRIDGPLKVSGRATFAAEVEYENLAYGSIVCSTIPRGRIAEIDTCAAEGAPGVALVMTYRNAPRLASPPRAFDDRQSCSASDLPVMQDDSIHWNGEPVALVLADSQEQADYAASLVTVSYQADTAHTDFDLLRPAAKPPHDILGEPPKVAIGRAEEALTKAAFVVDQTYRTPRHNHAAIEPHAVTVAWDEDGRLLVHEATQMLNGTRYTLAKVLGIGEDKIRVLSPFVGGGFGNKAIWSHQILAAAAARLTRRPVRIALPREQVFRLTGGRTLSEQRVALGSDEEGNLLALLHTGCTAVTAHNSFPEQFSFPARHLYAARNFLIDQKVVELDMIANTSMRAPGELIGTFALESAIDELAAALGENPIDLRRRLEPDRDPTTRRPFSSRHLMEAYAHGAERFGWHRREPRPRSQRQGDWLYGQGVATGTYPYYRMPGGVARITLTAAGDAVISMASHEMGMGTATVQTQHAAERLGLPVARVRFDYGDSDLPAGTMAGGSSQTASIAAAVAAAQEVLVKLLLKLAGNDSPIAGLRPSEVRAHDGGLCKSDEPGRHESYVSILRRSGRDQVEAEATAPMPFEMKKYSMHSYVAQFCEVRVHEITGEVRISRWLGSFDTGRILNPKTAASQFRGGIIMGIGLALTEETQFDPRSGRIMNASLSDYHVPVQMDVPNIDVIWTDIPDPHAPMGLHGIGEIGITGAAAAIANAVYNATGRRVRELPITLDKLL
ncbi:dehydrogenase [Labrys miyagiensis]